MRQHLAARLAIVGALAAIASPGSAGEDLSPEAVDQALKRGVQYLWSKQKADGSWPGYGKSPAGHYPAGPTALTTWALLESGASPQDPRLAKALTWLAKQNSTKTYTLALRANVWAKAESLAPARYLKLLVQDAARLWRSGVRGAYSYDSTGTPTTGRWDNSNTQYAVLGVRAAARANIELPRAYWQVVFAHWVTCQGQDGGWSYQRGAPAALAASRSTMTVGALASMLACHEELYAAKYTLCGRGAPFRPIQRGLAWLDKNAAASMKKPGGYYLCGLQRLGEISGRKHFGTVDWYRQGAEYLLRTQQPNGGWGNEVETAFAVLFLSRGRRPIVFGKLKYPGDWNNRPHALANLGRWTRGALCLPPCPDWQVVDIDRAVEDWHDVQILVIAGAEAPRLTPAQVARLRTFVLQGGAIFSCAECNGKQFQAGIRKVYAQMFPRYRLVKAARSHPVYTREVHYDFDLPGRPTLHIATNGVRPLITHTDEDLPLSWQLRKHVTQRWAFRAAVNTLRYARGSLRLCPERGTTHWPAPYGGRYERTVRLARLRGPGREDPEPLAYERFARLMAHRTRTKVEVLGPMAIRDLPAAKAQVATLTGTGRLELTGGEQDVLKRFIEGGGLLLVDAAGGSPAFGESAAKLLQRMFGPHRLRKLAPSAPLYRMKGREIERVRYRHRTQRRLAGQRTPNLEAVLTGSRIGLIFSREDITAGLVGYSSWTVDGYAPKSAFELMRNIVLSVSGP